ncbi:MAG: hypothetical protein ACLFVU_08545 [Phycisphaerae bacterium]
MIDEDVKREFRNQVRRARRDLLYMLDWMETELDRMDEPPKPPKKSKTTGRSNPDDRLNDRHHWIMDQLRDGVQLTRDMVMEHFQLGDRQAKRELTTLTNRGLIDFERMPRPGHYVLRVHVTRPDEPTI